SVAYRPSLKKQVAKEWEKLSKNEINQLKNILETKELPAKLENIRVLDALTRTIDFTQNRTKNNLSPDLAKLQRKSLIMRSQLPKDELRLEVYDQKNRPELSHKTQKISFWGRFEDSNFQMGLEIKQGFHDLMSRDLGYDSFSQFDFLSASVLYDFKNKKIKLNELMIVDLASLHEFLYYDPQPAWRAKVNYERIYDLSCKLCNKVNAQALGGLSYKPTDQSILNLMLGVSGEVSKHFLKGYRLGPMGEFSFYSLLHDQIKLGLSEEFKMDATKNLGPDYYHQATLKMSYFLTTNSDIRLESKFVSGFGKMKFETSIYEVKYGIFY
ncbi:MAG: hypothetical protein K2Q18_12950, partial [Bdellovibrionales bacterium]|nr:hypothetical protein [Bdellovibrionales bacterium]